MQLRIKRKSINNISGACRRISSVRLWQWSLFAYVLPKHESTWKNSWFSLSRQLARAILSGIVIYDEIYQILFLSDEILSSHCIVSLLAFEYPLEWIWTRFTNESHCRMRMTCDTSHITSSPKPFCQSNELFVSHCWSASINFLDTY